MGNPSNGSPDGRTASANHPTVVVSRCLLGEHVRYDGGHKHHGFVTGPLAEAVDLVPCCPEMELGMGVPREPIGLVRIGDQVRLLGSTSGRDFTEPMEEMAGRRVEELAALGISGAVLKARSPSCGVGSSPVIRRDGGIERYGSGLFASALLRQLPDLPVAQESELADPKSQEEYLNRVLEYWRNRGAAKG